MPSTLARPAAHTRTTSCPQPRHTMGLLQYLVRVSEPSPKPKRHGRLLRFGAALVVLLAVAGYLTVQYLTGSAAPKCRVVSAKGGQTSYEFTPEQAVNAATISAVGTTRGMSERAVTIALATAIQGPDCATSSTATGTRSACSSNAPRRAGHQQADHGSHYASGVFYDHLVKVPDYSRLPLTVAAQRVQRSGYPEAYAKHEPDAVCSPPH